MGHNIRIFPSAKTMSMLETNLDNKDMAHVRGGGFLPSVFGCNNEFRFPTALSEVVFLNDSGFSRLKTKNFTSVANPFFEK